MKQRFLFKFLLALEMAVDRSLGKTSRRGDVAQRGRLIALRVEKQSLLLQNLLFRELRVAHGAKIPIGILIHKYFFPVVVRILGLYEDLKSGPGRLLQQNAWHFAVSFKAFL